MDTPLTATQNYAAPRSSMSGPVELREENCGFARFARIEEQTVNGKTLSRVIVRGKFANVGKATDNGRVYPQRVWENQIQRLSPIFEAGERSWFGELDHPDKNRGTKLREVSHVVRKLWLETLASGEREVWGEAEIFPTVPHGVNLITLLEYGCRVGVSSRGRGSIVRTSEGHSVVGEDFMLEAFDFVADPAAGAYPERVMESVRTGSHRALYEGVGFTELLSAIAGGNTAASAEAPPRAPRTNSLASQILECFQGYVPESARPKESTVIPTSNGRTSAEMPRYATEQVEKLHRTNAAVLAENAKLAMMVKRSEFTRVLEHTLQNDPHAIRVRTLVGDVTHFADVTALNRRISEVQDTFSEERRVRLEEQLKQRRLEERAWRESNALREERDTLMTTLIRARDVIESQRLRIYAESRIGKHPQAASIRRLLEVSRLTTPEQVDTLIEEFRPAQRSRDAIAEAGARVRNRMGSGGFTSSSYDEEASEPSTRPHSHLPPRPSAHRPPMPPVGGGGGVADPRLVEDFRRYMPPGADM